MHASQVPEILRPYLKTAKNWLKQGYVQDIEFSEHTYQVLVKDPEKNKDCWTFLQFDDNDTLKDCFCSCEDTEEFGEAQLKGCDHLAAAWLRIHTPSGKPLHAAYRRSFWYAISRLFCERIGSDPESLKKVNAKEYAFYSASGKQIFSISSLSAQGEKTLQDILFEHPQETEETSIKFSNLSHEELQQWRIGQPSPQLAFELSFWSDLSKWMFFQQEDKKNYSINIKSEGHRLPHHFGISFKELKLDFYLSEANLPIIIPTLSTVNSPLKVIDNRLEGISKIVYNKQNSSLKIFSSDKKHSPDNGPIQDQTSQVIDAGEGWKYIEGEGFTAGDPHHLLENPVLTGSAVGQLLSDHTSLVKSFLEGAELHEEPVSIAYKLDFDPQWTLHVYSYLFEPGDLSAKGSAILGQWAYLNDEGLYKLEGLKFDTPHLQILPENVPNFIQQQRSWLNHFPGFQFHLSTIEEKLSYSVDAEGKLSFYNSEDPKKSFGLQHDFGSVIYIEGHGFYPKSWGEQYRPVREGVVIGKEQVPLFIKMQKDELQLIQGFFAMENPLESVGLSIKTEEQKHLPSINIKPVYLIRKEFQDKKIIFYDNYIYSEGYGFFEIPYSLRLPEAFRSEVTLRGEELELFISYQLEEIIPRATEIDEKLHRPHNIRLESIEMQPDGNQHFQANLQFTSEIGSISVVKVWEAMQRRQRYLISPAGLIDLTEDRFNWLRSIRKGRFNESGQLSLSSLELIRLNAFDEISNVPLSTQEKKGRKSIVDALIDFRQTETPTLRSLKSNLRPYQLLGVHWLWFLFQNGLSGLLCDDMGLGKTHQAMGLIDVLHQHEPNTSCLIVCPTSVLFHWQEKLHKFLPEIQVHTFYGNTRSLTHFHQTRGILLTSYGIARNEIEQLSMIPFDLIVMDEIQVAKNHQSRVHNALVSLQGRMRLGMTGTPLENHLRELKALFDLSLPAYLPSEQDFRNFFIKPIEKENNIARRLLLTRLIKPFILRRKKEDVLRELPPKIEEVAHCPLLNNQRKLYNEVITQQRPKVIDSLERGSDPIPYVHIFSILSSLKQICNHPAAYLKQPENYKEYSSGKWDLFVELLNEARHSGQKVVVFSHYLAMLDIMELYLDEHGVGYSSLRGSTRNRAEEVRRFQNDPSCEVFLGSLQAAGTGIDLTAASVVIHYDRWWNAAKEDQATDRVHRIGQARGVQVFKLVTKDTFEERIDRMITEKGKLMEEIVTTDDHQILKSFNRHDLLDLLKTVEAGKGVAAIEASDEL
ncbi:MAG: DEAD/DEAH box helicase [Parachlamydiales bacterium]|jgi:SNF2 family DNA or RNA helicase